MQKQPHRRQVNMATILNLRDINFASSGTSRHFSLPTHMGIFISVIFETPLLVRFRWDEMENIVGNKQG